MIQGLSQIGAQVQAFWRSLSPPQRVALICVAAVAFGAIGLLMNVARQPQMTTLFANLAPEDAAQIVDELTARGVEYELTHAGTAVQVPVERVYDLRLELATQGLPSSGPVGFELFDENNLSMTPFQQQMQYRRALEGELARTISRIGPVRWSRVHINLPARTAFARTQKHPSAAVVLGLRSGRSLSAADAASIGQLVAGAVEGLDAQQITIVDEKGRLLSRPGSDEDLLAAGALDVQSDVEKRLAARAQGLLDAAVGPGAAVVTVAATIDRKRFEEQQERVNPEESTVLSEERTEEQRTTPTPLAQGVPGTASNVPGGADAGTGVATGTETIARESVNYEFTRSKIATVIPMGEVQRLSVAVLVDGTYAAPEVPDGTEPPPPEYVPRTPEELATYTDIVKRAVGFDEQRGDEIVVQNLPFRSPLEGVGAQPPSFWESPLVHMMLPGLSRLVLALVGLLLLIKMVIRPAMQQLAGSPASALELASGTPETGGETPRLADPDAELSLPISQDQAKLVAEALRQWLRE